MDSVKQTYITRMPDKAGAFLQASRIIRNNKGNIVRVNYNKAVDAHTLFIEVAATETQHRCIATMLNELGYLKENLTNQKIILIVLKLEDTVGAVTPVLEVINSYDINVAYISSQENGTPYQFFKMGLMVENTIEIQKLLEDISKICEVKILDYDITEKNLDNTVFYISFANEIRDILGLSQEQTNAVIINSNRIMQLLDEKKESPLKTFDYIKRFANFVENQKGAYFHADISCEKVVNGIELYTIQPPCGSNTYVLKKKQELLFIDSGFACYKSEMTDIFIRLFGDLSEYKRSIILTHADIDHSGLLNMFDTIYLNKNCYNNFYLEQHGKSNFREQNVLHQPYCLLSKIISNYTPPNLDKCIIIGDKQDDKLLSYIGELGFGNLSLELFEGAGGHVKGEMLIVCRQCHLVFTGDLLVNIKGFSPKQQQFNQLAPYLMTSVNADSKKATLIRELIEKEFAEFSFYPGHGSPIIK